MLFLNRSVRNTHVLHELNFFHCHNFSRFQFTTVTLKMAKRLLVQTNWMLRNLLLLTRLVLAADQ